VYKPGQLNGKVDASTRMPGDLPEGEDETVEKKEQVVLKPQNVPEQLRLLVDSTPAWGHPSVSNLMSKAYQTDPLPGKILEAIRTNSGLQEATVAECTEEHGRVRYRGSLYVPDNAELHLRIIQGHHDTPLAGHPGRAKTFDLLNRGYFWYEMGKDVDR